MPEAATDIDHTFYTPELSADMTKADIVHVLQYLRFAKDGSCLIRIDKSVRDFLVSQLSQRH